MKIKFVRFTEAVVVVAFAAGASGVAHGQSPVQFWIEQQHQFVPQYQSYPGSGMFFAPWQYRRSTQPNIRTYARAPRVEVKAPGYRTYVPDRPQTTTLDKICHIDVASNAAVSPAPDTPTFAQACAVAPVTTLRVLPLVAAALNDYYASHPHFVWISHGDISAKARAAMAELALSDRFGLVPQDYDVSLPKLEGGEATRLKALMTFELNLSAKVLTYVLDAERGRVDADRMSDYYDLPRKHVDLIGALEQITQTNDIVAFLDSRNPDNRQFRALVAALAEARTTTAKQPIALVGHIFIQPGASNAVLPRVIAAIRRRASDTLRRKHAGTLAGYKGSDDYGPRLVALVRDFQKENGLYPDGIIGSKTIRVLTAKAPREKTEKLILALERLRWLPRQLGPRYVFLNEAAFEVTYVNGSEKPVSMPAVVGKPTSQTYVFTDTIRAVEYNPYWNVPRSILINEMLPHLYRNPSYLTRHGYVVTTASGRQVPSSAVNWSQVARNHISVDVKQPPGPRNALGRLKIEFPNKHAIYMHDTPERQLFNYASRAFSHGCVRLKYPREMAAALLGKPISYIDERIAEGKNVSEKVPGNIPVYLAYFTAWPDPSGTIHYYKDVYGRDAHLSDALAKTEAARQAG